MKNVILVVDDEPINLSVLTTLLKPYFTVRASRSGEDALRLLAMDPKPDLILLDIMMPGIDGFETLRRIREDSGTRNIPVIFISSLDSVIDEDKGFRLGAVDYVVKPFRPAVIMARVNAHLELKQARDRLADQNHWLEAEVSRRLHENQVMQDASLIALTQLAETRDDNTGNHIERTCRYIELLARNLQKKPKYENILDEKTLLMIVKAAPLHDIGKIGMPDSVLLKPGRLTPVEYGIIKNHCMIGANALRRAINKSLGLKCENRDTAENASLLYLEQAETIIKYHHEKWDGTGYPFGLKGEEIPLSARLMALADVFDALTTSRPYKDAWSMAQAADYIISQKGLHFDPDIVQAFEEVRDSFEEVLLKMRDDAVRESEDGIENCG